MIDKLIRNAPLLLVLVLIIALVLLFNFSGNLGKAIERLERAEARLDTSLSTIALAGRVIDSVKSDLTRFGSSIRDIQHQVEILDLSERSGSERFKSQKESILRRLRELSRDIEATGKELPEIPVVLR